MLTVLLPLLLGLALLGGRRSSSRSAHFAMAFSSGAALLAASGVVVIGSHAILGASPPFVPAAVALAALAAVSAFALTSARIRVAPVASGLAGAVAAAAVALAAGAFRARLATADSFIQMLSAEALATRGPGPLIAEPYTFYSFPPAMKVLHAPAAALGSAAAYPLSMAATAALLTLLANLAYRQGILEQGTLRAGIVAAGAVALALSSAQMITMSRYVNGHTLVALWLLVLISALASAEEPRRYLWDLKTSIPAHLAVVGIVLARVEGMLLVGLVLAAFSSSGSARGHVRRLWFSLAAATGVWYALATHLFLADGQRPPGALLVSPLLVAACLLAPYLSERLPARFGLGALVAAGLLLGTFGYAVLEPLGFRRSLSATWTNLTVSGGWGLSFLVTLAAAGLALLHSRHLYDPVLRRVWYVVAGFIPLALIAAWLREGAYRVGQGDSLNRMLVHIFPLLVLLAASWRRTDTASVRDTAQTDDIGNHPDSPC